MENSIFDVTNRLYNNESLELIVQLGDVQKTLIPPVYLEKRYCIRKPLNGPAKFHMHWAGVDNDAWEMYGHCKSGLLVKLLF